MLDPSLPLTRTHAHPHAPRTHARTHTTHAQRTLVTARSTNRNVKYRFSTCGLAAGLANLALNRSRLGPQVSAARMVRAGWQGQDDVRCGESGCGEEGEQEEEGRVKRHAGRPMARVMAALCLRNFHRAPAEPARRAESAAAALV